jgi:hypothetical protein
MCARFRLAYTATSQRDADAASSVCVIALPANPREPAHAVQISRDALDRMCASEKTCTLPVGNGRLAVLIRTQAPEYTKLYARNVRVEAITSESVHSSALLVARDVRGAITDMPAHVRAEPRITMRAYNALLKIANM